MKIKLYNLRNLIDKIKIADVLDSHPDFPALYVSKEVCLFEEHIEIQDGGSNEFT